MTRRRLLRSLDSRRVEAAIRQAEEACGVELRVSVAGLFWGDPQAVARRAFERLGMTDTARRIGLLIFIAPWRRKVVIVGDDGITARVGPHLWSETVATITAAFHEGQFTEGLERALADLALTLAPHFPPDGAGNELPDAVVRAPGRYRR